MYYIIIIFMVLNFLLLIINTITREEEEKEKKSNDNFKGIKVSRNEMERIQQRNRLRSENGWNNVSVQQRQGSEDNRTTRTIY